MPRASGVPLWLSLTLHTSSRLCSDTLSVPISRIRLSVVGSHDYCCCWPLLYSANLRSRVDSLSSHVIPHEWIAFYSACQIVVVVVVNIHRSGVLTALAWLVLPHELLPSRRVLCTPYNHAPCHFTQSHKAIFYTDYRPLPLPKNPLWTRSVPRTGLLGLARVWVRGLNKLVSMVLNIHRNHEAY